MAVRSVIDTRINAYVDLGAVAKGARNRDPSQSAPPTPITLRDSRR